MKIIKNVTLALSAILLIMPLLTGCWDRREIEDRANVLGISIDPVSKREKKAIGEITHLTNDMSITEKNMISVSVQIALPGRIPLGPGESGGESSSKQTVWVLSSAGHTLSDALANIQQQVSSKLFFGHLRIIVVSDEIAKRGLNNINLYLRSNSEIRTNTWMVISKGKANVLMEAAPELERVPILYLLSTLEEGVRMGKLPKDILALFWSNLSKKGQEGFLPYVEKEKGENIRLAGLCNFKNDKMVDVIEPIEVLGYMGIKGINPAGAPVIINVPGEKGTISVYSTKRKSRMKVSLKNGRPRFTVNTIIELNINEKSNKDIHIDQETIKKVEKELGKELSKQYKELVKKTQKENSDIFGFGEYVRAKQPRYWDERIKTKEKWQEIYEQISVDIKVKTKIRRVGMTTI